MGDNTTQPKETLEDQIRHQGVISEDIQHQVQRLAEAMAEVPATVQKLSADVDELKTDMKVVKAAVTDQSGVLHDHESRITQLESAV